MNALAPSSLSSETLACRLRELTGEERNVLVDFLLHLDEFDRRRAFLEAGYDSLWTYCLQALHLREGAAGRRIAAMRVLRRFPALESVLRDGRLCLSTVTLLGPLLTGENLDELVARAAYLTKADTEHLVAAIQPRVAPKQGVRKLPERPEPAREPAAASAEPISHTPAESGGPSASGAASAPVPSLALPEPGPSSPAAPPLVETRRPAEIQPVSRDAWSLRVTIGAVLKADLETLTSLLSHTSGGDLAAVLHEAIRCGIEKHGKRKGAVKPSREGPPDRKAEPIPGARAVPAEVRRQVWERDGGRCTWTGKDGRRCESRWKLELDHIRPVALGGSSTVENLRLCCRSHNILHAEQVFGLEHMARFMGPARIESNHFTDRSPP